MFSKEHDQLKETLDKVISTNDADMWFIVKQIALLLKPFINDIEMARKYFSFWETQGIHVTPVNFYSPIPDTKNLADSTWEKRTSMAGIDMNLSEQLRMLNEIFAKYRPEYEQYLLNTGENELEFTFDNTQFVGPDPYILHSIVREYKPNRIIEVGSGFSTLVSANAIRLNGKGQITCIEPYPRDFVQKIPQVQQLIKTKVQDIDITFFQQLKNNDILFIDSTHVVKIGSDVQYLFLEVLPQLQSGVLIHVHDVFFPNEYPEKWIREKNFFWNEQYFLQAFLIGNSLFKIIFAVGFMGKNYTIKMKQVFPRYEVGMGGGSFWMLKL